MISTLCLYVKYIDTKNKKMGQEYRRKNTSCTLINYHFIWIPRRRRKVLVGDVRVRCEELIRDKCKQLTLEILELAIEPDHIHLFVNCPPDIAPHQIMFNIKGYSSRFLRKEFPHLLKMPSMWTRSYFCSTAGNVSSETIKKYIAAQGTRD